MSGDEGDIGGAIATGPVVNTEEEDAKEDPRPAGESQQNKLSKKEPTMTVKEFHEAVKKQPQKVISLEELILLARQLSPEDLLSVLLKGALGSFSLSLSLTACVFHRITWNGMFPINGDAYAYYYEFDFLKLTIPYFYCKKSPDLLHSGVLWSQVFTHFGS